MSRPVVLYPFPIRRSGIGKVGGAGPLRGIAGRYHCGAREPRQARNG